MTKITIGLGTYNMTPRDEAIRKAHECVEKSCNGQGREWLIGEPVKCLAGMGYGAEVHVLNGTPPRGFVLVIKRGDGGDMFGDRPVGYAIALDLDGRRLKRFSFGIVE